MRRLMEIQQVAAHPIQDFHEQLELNAQELS